MATGIPVQGPQQLQVGRGVLGMGLTLAGTHALSGASNGITTTFKAIGFQSATFATDGKGRVPRLIRFKGTAQILTVAFGDVAAISVTAADTWTAWYACTALFEGADAWWVKAAGTCALDYEIVYT